MSPRIDPSAWIGTRFGKLVAIEVASSGDRPGTRLICRCDCGNSKTVFTRDLVRSDGTGSRSCGCNKNISRPKHGHSNSPTYNSWISMRARCDNPNAPGYHNYGGRGIRVCKRWLTKFSNFLEDMGERPSVNYSIDRIDNNVDYTPANCKWSTIADQNRNKRTVVKIWHESELLTIPQICNRLGLKSSTVWNRINYLGWSVEAALNKEPR